MCGTGPIDLSGVTNVQQIYFAVALSFQEKVLRPKRQDRIIIIIAANQFTCTDDNGV